MADEGFAGLLPEQQYWTPGTGPAAAVAPTGWRCPGCGNVYAPHVERCGQCIPQPVQSTGTGTLGKDALCSYCGGALWVCRGSHNVC